MRLASRKDEGQADLVADLRKLRFQVKVLNDTPDLIVRIPFSGHIILLEVDGVTKNRKRTGAQLDFLHDWNIPRVTTLDEALHAIEDYCTEIARLR